MPRKARLVIPGLPHHVVQRANRGKALFFDDLDRRRYLDLLAKYAARQHLRILAYCLMPDHVHLVAVPAAAGVLTAVLMPLQIQHSKHIRRTHTIRGRLWQRRFASCPMDLPHMWEAVRYVERNPRRAGKILRPDRYAWSSAGGHAGIRKDPLLSGNLEARGKVKNWVKWLCEGEDEAMVETIRRCTRTGRPAGRAAFRASIEKRLRRPRRPKKGKRRQPPKKGSRPRKARTKAKGRRSH
jgi:putative transposase